MADNPLGPFSQYITQPLDQTPEHQPTGYEGAGGAIAHVATSFLNGMKQARAQKFALQAMQEHKEEDAYNTAIQHLEASGLTEADKQLWKAKLAVPLLHRMAQSQLTSKDTGHPGTDFFKGLAQNLIGGQLPAKKGPLDLSVPLDAIAYASDPQNSAAFKSSALDAKAAELVRQVTEHGGQNGGPATQDDLEKRAEYGPILQEYHKLNPGKVPSAFAPLLAVKTRQATPVTTGTKVDQAFKAYRDANGLGEDDNIPLDIKNRILQRVGVLAPAAVSKGVVVNRTAVAMGERFPFETDLFGQPKKPGELYSLGNLDGKEGIVPVDRNMYTWERVIGQNGQPTIISRNRLNNQTTVVPEYAPVVKTGTSTNSGGNDDGSTFTNTQTSYATPHAFVPGARTASIPAATAPLSKPTTVTPPTNGNPFIPQASTVQDEPPARVNRAKWSKLGEGDQKLVLSSRQTLDVMQQLKGLLEGVDPSTGKQYKDENNLSDRFRVLRDSVTRKLGFAPNDSWESIMSTAGLGQAYATSAFATTSRGKALMELVNPHVPNASENDGRLLYSKVNRLIGEVAKVEPDILNLSGTMVRPGQVLAGPPGANRTQSPPATVTKKKSYNANPF